MSRGMTLISLLSWSVVFMNEIDPTVAAEECSVNSHCRATTFSTKVCCAGLFTGVKSCRFGTCIGRFCSTDGDCGGIGECCKFNKCTTTGCSQCFSNFGCVSSEYCCKQRFASDQNVCRRSCIGETCLTDFDCGGPNEYCDSSGKCARKLSNQPPQLDASSASVAGWVIGLIVTVSILVAIVLGGVCLYRRCRRKPQPGAVLQRQPAAANTNIVLQVANKASQGAAIIQPHTQSTMAALSHVQTSAAPHHLIHTTSSDSPTPSAPPLSLLTPPVIVSTPTAPPPVNPTARTPTTLFSNQTTRAPRILPIPSAQRRGGSNIISSLLEQGQDIAQPELSLDTLGMDASSFLDSSAMDMGSNLGSSFMDLCSM